MPSDRPRIRRNRFRLAIALVLTCGGIASGAAPNPCANTFLKDLDPAIQGEISGITSPRFMRRMWLHDGRLLALFQQGGHDGRFLSLYTAAEESGRTWTFLDNVSGTSGPDRYLSGDGFLTPEGDLLLVISSRQALVYADVEAVRYVYMGEGSWLRDPASPVTVTTSSSSVRKFNATLARDSEGRLFVFYVKIDNGNYSVRYSYSTNGGGIWTRAPKAFTLSDTSDHKSARVTTATVAGEPALAVVYYDHDGAGEYLRWDYRLDSAADPAGGWAFDELDPAREIRAMPADPLPSMYRHWSVARDPDGGLHVTWEEQTGIHYSRYDGNGSGLWDAPIFLVDGVYSSVTTSAGTSPSFVYVFADRNDTVVAGAYDPFADDWTPFRKIGDGGRGPRRRVSSPEQFVGGIGSLLPVVFQNENEPPEPKTQVLFSVLRDCQ